MLLKYFDDKSLAHASYMVGCQRTGEAIVIDPSRAVDQYIEAAATEGLRITGLRNALLISGAMLFSYAIRNVPMNATTAPIKNDSLK